LEKYLGYTVKAMADDKVVQIGKYQIRVDRNLCIGAASCVAVSPNVFELDGEKKAVIKEGSNDTPENLLLAAQACPTKAIIITDTETGKQVWPA
jgi:ferredoxin